MRWLLLMCVLTLAGCAGRPSPSDPLAIRERLCGPERQTSTWHDCNAKFIADRPELLGTAAADTLSRYHADVARALFAMEHRRMSQAEGREVVERLTDAMQQQLPAARAKDNAAGPIRSAFCYPLAGGGQYCVGG
jgi:hypothetical protein